MLAQTPSTEEDRAALSALLKLILSSVEGIYAQADVPLPDRRYIAYGQVAADCEQLTVELGQVYVGLPGADPNTLQRCDGPRTAITIVTLFRKICEAGPRGTAPTPEQMTADAEALSQDAWLLLDSAAAVDAAGWKTGVIAEVSPINPSGGYAGLAMTLTVTVP